MTDPKQTADTRRSRPLGLPRAVSSAPDGMASAALIGVNPVCGLYASLAGPIAGGLTSSTGLMVIAATTAAASRTGFFHGHSGSAFFRVPRRGPIVETLQSGVLCMELPAAFRMAGSSPDARVPVLARPSLTIPRG